MMLRYLAYLILVITGLLLISIIAVGGLLFLMILLGPFIFPIFLIAFGAILILIGILTLLFALK